MTISELVANEVDNDTAGCDRHRLTVGRERGQFQHRYTLVLDDSATQ